MKADVIFRKDYLKKIEPFIGDSLIKIIVGQRRVGKSYLLLQLMVLFYSNIQFKTAKDNK